MRVIALVFLATLDGCQAIRFDEESLIHPDQQIPHAGKPTTRPLARQSSFATLAPGYESSPVAFTHADGNISRGMYFHRPGATVTVLFFGGNSFRLDDDAESAQYISALSRSGVDLVIFDHRGYGRSGGAATAALLASDGLDLYDDARARVKTKLIVYGHSLGSLIAPYIAQRRKLDGMVLEGTITNMEDFADTFLPRYLAPFINVTVDEQLLWIDNAKALKQYTAPILLISGQDDDVMSPALAKKLYDAVGSNDKTFKLVPGYGHNNLNTSPDYLESCQTFFKKVGES